MRFVSLAPAGDIASSTAVSGTASSTSSTPASAAFVLRRCAAELSFGKWFPVSTPTSAVRSFHVPPPLRRASPSAPTRSGTSSFVSTMSRSTTAAVVHGGSVGPSPASVVYNPSLSGRLHPDTQSNRFRVDASIQTGRDCSVRLVAQEDRQSTRLRRHCPAAGFITYNQTHITNSMRQHCFTRPYVYRWTGSAHFHQLNGIHFTTLLPRLAFTGDSSTRNAT